MGILQNTAGNSLQKALRKGQASTQQQAKALEAQLKHLESEIVDRMNWLMKNQQKIMDHLKLEVDDPLEE